MQQTRGRLYSVRTTPPALRKDERNQRNHDGGEERPPVNASRLPAELLAQAVVVNALFARVQIARPARGQRDSSLLPRLQQP